MFGFCAGSFIAAGAYRLPRGLNWVNDRSRCNSCHHILAWYDLVPVISFLWLRGRCRYCRAKIPLRNLLIELYMGAIFLLAYIYLLKFGIWYLVFSLLLASCFLLLALIDYDLYILPDPILSFMALIGLAYLIFFGAPTYEFRPVAINAIQTVGVYPHLSWLLVIKAILLLLVFWILWLATKGKAFGFGDAKYLAVLALLFGLRGSIITMMAATFLGGLVSVALLASKRAGLKTQLPFGVFLSTAATAYILGGAWFYAHFGYWFF